MPSERVVIAIPRMVITLTLFVVIILLFVGPSELDMQKLRLTILKWRQLGHVVPSFRGQYFVAIVTILVLMINISQILGLIHVKNTLKRKGLYVIEAAVFSLLLCIAFCLESYYASGKWTCPNYNCKPAVPVYIAAAMLLLLAIAGQIALAIVAVKYVTGDESPVVPRSISTISRKSRSVSAMSA